MPRRLSQKPNQFIKKIMNEVATELDAQLEMLDWSAAGIVVFPDGVRIPFDRNHNDFVGAGAYQIAHDKHLVSCLLKQNNIQTPQTEIVRSKDYNSVEEYRKEIMSVADTVGYPLYIKPNDGGMGKGVYRIQAQDDLVALLEDMFLVQYPDSILQRVVGGIDIRVIVFRGQVVGVMGRKPLSVTGDGVQTIHELLQEKRAPSTIKKFKDGRIQRKLDQLGFSFDDIPQAGEKIYLLDSANISSGGTPVDFTKVLHESYLSEAVRAADVLGLEFTGVDVLIDGDHTQPGADMVILEVNSPCGVKGYASIGQEQYTKIRSMYVNMFRLAYERKKIKIK